MYISSFHENFSSIFQQYRLSRKRVIGIQIVIAWIVQYVELLKARGILHGTYGDMVGLIKTSKTLRRLVSRKLIVNRIRRRCMNAKLVVNL